MITLRLTGNTYACIHIHFITNPELKFTKKFCYAGSTPCKQDP